MGLDSGGITGITLSSVCKLKVKADTYFIFKISAFISALKKSALGFSQ